MECLNCRKNKGAREFYSSPNSIISVDGKIPICKVCLSERYDLLLEQYDNNEKAIEHLCRNIDIYYDKDLVADDIEIRKYIKLLCKSSVSREKTSMDNTETIVEEEVETVKVDPKLKKIWGANFTQEEYEQMQNFFNEYSNFYETKTPAEKDILIDAAKYRRLKDRAIEQDQDPKLVSLYDKLYRGAISDNNMKPSQNNDEEDKFSDLIGVMARRIETTRPIKEQDMVYKDAAKTKEMLKKYYVTPLLNSVGGKL